MILNQCDAPVLLSRVLDLAPRANEKRALYASGRRTSDVAGELAAVPRQGQWPTRPVGFAVGEVSKQRLRLQGSGADKGFADDRRPDDQNWCGRRSELGLIQI
jgi:hypothetical protein